MTFKTNLKNKLEANLIPLLDVIFVILIFFLILFRFSSFSPSETPEDSINIPEGNLSRTFELESTAFIEMTQDGVIFFNGKNMVLNDMIDTIRNMGDISNLGCIIIVDENAPFEFISPLLDGLKKVGVKRISFIK